MEHKFERLTMSNLLETTVAKFNQIDIFIESCSKETILEAHDGQAETEAKNKMVDFQNRKARIEKIHGKNLKENDQMDRLQIGACLCETNEDLIPKDLSQVSKCYKKFKKECLSTGTSPLGERQYKLSLLLCLHHLLTLSVPEVVSEKDFEWSESTAKKEIDSKLSKALLLYSSFHSQIRTYVSFG